MGVAPPDFFGVDPAAAPDIYLPLHALEYVSAGTQWGFRASSDLEPHYCWIQIMGRLRPGVTRAQAQAALAPAFQQWVTGTATNDTDRANLPALVVREGAGGLDSLRRSYSKPLYVLLALVGSILAVACANVANLLMARASAGESEMAVRLSIGPGQAQRANFSAADGYERFMGRWSRALAPLLVQFGNVRDGDAILDVGSGTGALTAALASAAPASRIVGIDPAASYVEFAKRQHGGGRIIFEIGDARKMRFVAASFDRTMSLPVINFIPDAARAVDEMKRVTKPGGMVVAAVWDHAEGMEMVRRDALFIVRRLLGAIPRQAGIDGGVRRRAARRAA